MINAISYVAPQTSSKADTDAAEREMQFVVSIIMTNKIII